jgi:hypothetical protein
MIVRSLEKRRRRFFKNREEKIAAEVGNENRGS